MEPAVPFDWHRIFIGDEPLLYYAEIIFRITVIYVYALVLIRSMGKRGSRNLSPMENIVVIALGSATGDAMFYPQVPLTYAAVVITVLVIFSRLLASLEVRSKSVDHFVDGSPMVMVVKGEVQHKALQSARLREDELFGMLRTQGLDSTATIRLALLERTGELSVLEFDAGEAAAGVSTWPTDLQNPEALGVGG